MLPDKSQLATVQRTYNDNFRSNFSYEEFEKRAEELEKTNPGKGYQLSYYESLGNVFKDYLTNAMTVNHLPGVPSFLASNFDYYVMGHYKGECKRQGVDPGFETQNNFSISLTTAELFNNILENTVTTLKGSISKKFESGEMNMDKALEFARKKSENRFVIEKGDAALIAGYAKVLEEKNKSRSWLDFFLNIPTHFREKSAIKELKKIAQKGGDPEEIEKLVNEDNKNVKNIKSDVAKSLNAARERSTEKEKLDLSDVFKETSHKKAEKINEKTAPTKNMEIGRK